MQSLSTKDPELNVFTAEAESDDAAYFDEVVTKTYNLSSDTSVFWRINDIFENYPAENNVEASSEGNEARSASLDDFNIVWDPEDAEKVKTDMVNITISTIPGKTLKGDYSFNVQTSEDGETWNDYEVLDTSSVTTTTTVGNLGSSGGGCNFGLSAMGLGLVLVTMLIKNEIRD